MKQCSENFINELSTVGRQLDCKVTYTQDNVLVVLHDELYSISLSYHTSLLKSAMKELIIESTTDIPKETIVNVQVGLLVNSTDYEYLDYGSYIVYESEKQIDEGTYRLKCYDKMLYAMKNYESPDVSYPITIKEYLSALCLKIGLPFKDTEFTNENKEIPVELYENLGYTYRDVLDEIAQVTASTICINESDQVEVRYLNETDTIVDENELKDVDVNVGEKYGPINSIVLSRVNADNVYLRDEESVEQNGLCEIKIIDNQIMNFNNRSEFLPEILERLDGLEYYTNDYTSTGLLIYDMCDVYTLAIENQDEHRCIMFNDEIVIDNGIEENVFTQLLDEAETDYTKADKTDQRLNKTTLIVDKQNQEIESLISSVNENFTRVYQDIDNIEVNVQNSGGSNLIINSVMFGVDNNKKPTEWTLANTGTINIEPSAESLRNGCLSGNAFTLANETVSQTIRVTKVEEGVENPTYYSFSCKVKKNAVGNAYIKIYNSIDEHIKTYTAGENAFWEDVAFQALLPHDDYYIIEFYGDTSSGFTVTDAMFNIGQYKTQWQQASGEVMNSQVNIDTNGILVRSSIYEGNYTVMTPLEFAGYSSKSVEPVFSLNDDTTVVEKIEIKSQVDMPPIKIVPITTGNNQGWAFVADS